MPGEDKRAWKSSIKKSPKIQPAERVELDMRSNSGPSSSIAIPQIYQRWKRKNGCVGWRRRVGGIEWLGTGRVCILRATILHSP